MPSIQRHDDDEGADQVAQSGEQLSSEPGGRDPLQIQVLEESISIGKRIVKGDTVSVSTQTHAVEEIAEVTMRHTVVDIERIAINRIVEKAAEIRTEGDVTVIPVMEEQFVIVKQLLLKEEIHIRKRTKAETVRQPVELLRQHVKIRRGDAD